MDEFKVLVSSFSFGRLVMNLKIYSRETSVSWYTTVVPFLMMS